MNIIKENCQLHPEILRSKQIYFFYVFEDSFYIFLNLRQKARLSTII